MATLVLQTVGQALGGALGGPFGAAIGSALGGVAGSIVDQALFGPPPRQIEGPRLNELHVTGSTEGAPVPEIWGRMRVSGQLIWATNFEEEITHRSEGGGKGSLSKPTAEYTEYAYYGNFAIALGDGPVDRIGRIWADGKEINPADIEYRFYGGSQDQQPDALIVAKEGADRAPAYRGIAYIVFDHLPLARFGNRIPQFSFELFRSLDGVEAGVQAVNIIPGSTEFGYDTQQVRREDGFGGTTTENVHSFNDKADFVVSLDQLQATCPNLGSANLVVAWFGDDLRCGDCTIAPRIDNEDKITHPASWSVAGRTRANAQLVTQANGRAAYGGTPDDGSVVRAIQEMKVRGIEVCFYPFVLMDVAAGNALPNPYTGQAGQPAYPWRGEITCIPAIGQPGTVDATAAARTQVESFFGTAQPADFTVVNGEVIYSGPDDWSYRRMILHYAYMCQFAGGVEAFLIGTEMVALNRIRDDMGRFIAVEQFKALAADVAGILPEAKISYAADWSEYSNYRPANGSNDIWFHLDELWADPNVHFVGIDNYMPLSDWRDGSSHLDYQGGWRSIHDKTYLKAGIEGGEGYDWYYANSANRAAQLRTPINDNANGKHWVFRPKDLRNWWSQQHFNRPGGVESQSATDWVPMSKPVRFTEFGFPAVDKATNQPNVFHDPKSSSSGFPYFSSGRRDDLLQRQAIAAVQEYWSPATGNNPVSATYGGPMLETDKLALWAWDARPYPAFPFLEEVWSDGANHQLGHWLNGRMGSLELAELIASLMQRYGVTEFDAASLQGVVEGFQVDRQMTARGAIEALSDIFMFDAVESNGLLKFFHRRQEISASVSVDELVREDPQGSVYELRRLQETELPRTINLAFSDSGADYQRSSVYSSHPATQSENEDTVEFAGVMAFGEAQGHARRMLNVIWSGRESATFALPPSRLAVEPGDVIEVEGAGSNKQWRLVETSQMGHSRVSAAMHDPAAFELISSPARRALPATPALIGRVQFAVLDLPLLSGTNSPYAPWVASAARPWPGQVRVLQDQGGDSLSTAALLTSPAVMGKLLTALQPGPQGVWDRGARIHVRLSHGSLQSRSELDVLAGANIAAIGTETGGREIIQFQKAELIAPQTYELSILLRAQSGTDGEMESGAPVGADFVLIDNSVRQLPVSPDNVGRDYNLRAGPGTVDAASELYQDLNFAFVGRGLRPLSPVHARALPSGGDIEINWIRRTRIGGDAWQAVEVPLSEDGEAYEVDVISGGNVVRTIAISSATASYTNAQQQADFPGQLPQDLSFNIYQKSLAYGRGSPSKVTLNG